MEAYLSCFYLELLFLRSFYYKKSVAKEANFQHEPSRALESVQILFLETKKQYFLINPDYSSILKI